MTTMTTMLMKHHQKKKLPNQDPSNKGPDTFKYPNGIYSMAPSLRPHAALPLLN